MTMQDPKDLDGAPLELLIKLMKMTDAEDNIALIAIRKANGHLSKLGADWESLLRGKVRVIADPFANINIPASAMNPNRNQEYCPSAVPLRPKSKPQHMPPNRPGPNRSTVRPKPGAPPFTTDVCEKTIVNKHDGTCTMCKNRVLAGDGIAKLWSRPDSTTYWTSMHYANKCPPSRKFRPATTADDFQL